MKILSSRHAIGLAVAGILLATGAATAQAQASGATPPVLPGTFDYADPLGSIGGYQLNGPVHTAGNAFFESLGTNGRSCASRHPDRVTPCSRPLTGRIARVR